MQKILNKNKIKRVALQEKLKDIVDQINDEQLKISALKKELEKHESHVIGLKQDKDKLQEQINKLPIH